MRSASCALALLVAARTAVADVVVLRSQVRFTGAVANRETIRSAKFVSILVAASVPDSFELVRIPAGEIEYVVLEDGSRKVVYDFTIPAAPARAPASPCDEVRLRARPTSFSSYWSADRPASSNHEAGGVILAITGVVLFSFGLYGYTQAGAYLWGPGIYTPGPMILMAGGGVMAFAGVVIAAQPSSPSALRDPGAAPLYAGLTTRF